VARSRPHRVLARGFAEFEAWRDAALEEEERAAHKFDRKIAAEEDWLRYGVPRGEAQSKASCGSFRCAMSSASGAPLDQSSSRPPRRIFPAAVIEAKDAENSLGAGDRQELLDPHFARRPSRPDRANGAQDTLLGLLTGALPPDQGLSATAQSFAGVARQAGEPRSGNSLERRAHRRRQRFRRDQRERKHVIGYMKEFLFGRNRRARRSGGSRAANAEGSCSRGSWRGPPISSFSTSRPTISISKR